MDEDQFRREYYGDYCEPEDKIYIIASSIKMAASFARKAKLSPSRWVYVSSEHKLQVVRGKKIVLVEYNYKINDVEKFIRMTQRNDCTVMTDNQYLQCI